MVDMGFNAKTQAPGQGGLPNMGQTCHINVAAQMLIVILNYLPWLNPHSSGCPQSGFCLLCAVAELRSLCLRTDDDSELELKGKMRLIVDYWGGGLALTGIGRRMEVRR